MTIELIYYIDKNIIYTLNLKNDELKKIFTIKDTQCFYEYFNNHTELMIIIKERLIFFNNEGKIEIDIKHNWETNLDLLDIIKYKNKYYIFKKSKIIIFDKDFEVIQLENPIMINNYYNKYAKIFFYEDELYYTNYLQDEINYNEILVSLILTKVNLNNKTFESEKIFEKILLKNTNLYNSNIYFFLTDILVYKNYIISAIVNDLKTDLIQYDLKTNKIMKNIISSRISGIKIIDDSLLVINHFVSYDNAFMLYDIEKLYFREYLQMNREPVNGYFDIYVIKNKLIIFVCKYNFSNVEYNNSIFIYKRSVTLQNIKLGALALKHYFKNELNINFGQHQDVKELILDKMKSKTLLDENDNVKSCKITDYNYQFETSFPLTN